MVDASGVLKQDVTPSRSCCMAHCPFLPACTTAGIAANPPYCIVHSPLWYLGELLTFCRRAADPLSALSSPNAMAFGEQQMSGNVQERAAHVLLMVVSGRGHASECVSEYAVTGLQSSLLIVWERG